MLGLEKHRSVWCGLVGTNIHVIVCPTITYLFINFINKPTSTRTSGYKFVEVWHTSVKPQNRYSSQQYQGRELHGKVNRRILKDCLKGKGQPVTLIDIPRDCDLNQLAEEIVFTTLL